MHFNSGCRTEPKTVLEPERARARSWIEYSFRAIFLERARAQSAAQLKQISAVA